MELIDEKKVYQQISWNCPFFNWICFTIRDSIHDIHSSAGDILQGFCPLVIIGTYCVSRADQQPPVVVPPNCVWVESDAGPGRCSSLSLLKSRD